MATDIAKISESGILFERLTESEQNRELFEKLAQETFSIDSKVVVRWNKEIIGVSEPDKRFIFYVSVNELTIKFQGESVISFSDTAEETLISMCREKAELMKDNPAYAVKQTIKETKEEKNRRLFLEATALVNGIHPKTGELLEPKDKLREKYLIDIVKIALKELRSEQKAFDNAAGFKTDIWDKVELELLSKLYREGKTTHAIASKLNRSDVSIFDKLQEIGEIPSISSNDDSIVEEEEVEQRPRCEDCQLLRAEQCGGMGDPLLCRDFVPLPTITREEIAMWPRFGLANYLRLRSQDDGHHEI